MARFTLYFYQVTTWVWTQCQGHARRLAAEAQQAKVDSDGVPLS